MNNISLKNNTISLQNLLDAVNDLPEKNSGIELPKLTNEGSSHDLLLGKQLIDSNGNIVDGIIETKDSGDIIVSGATITVPTGYYNNTATTNIPIVDQAIPSISIDSSGLITASATQNAGYVIASIKNTTHQLAFQPAKTITPSTTDQIAVSGSHYTGGDIVVKGDSNLTAENIKSGISIFGVNGSLEGSNDSGENNKLIEIIERTIATIENNNITIVGPYAFCKCSTLMSVNFPNCNYIDVDAFLSCTSLTAVNFPNCNYISNYAFLNCTSLTTADFPNCDYIGAGAFSDCTSLTTINFPNCSFIGAGAFYNCISLTAADFPKCTDVKSSAFYYCKALSIITLAASKIGTKAFQSCNRLASFINIYSSVAKLDNKSAFYSTPMSLSTYRDNKGNVIGWGSIYVPASLVDVYKSATNWTAYADRITAIVEQ